MKEAILGTEQYHEVMRELAKRYLQNKSGYIAPKGEYFSDAGLERNDYKVLPSLTVRTDACVHCAFNIERWLHKNEFTRIEVFGKRIRFQHACPSCGMVSLIPDYYYKGDTIDE